MRGLRALIAVSASVCAVALAAGGVHRVVAVAPSATAWWSVAGVPGGTVPRPPDMGSGDLLVAGAGGANLTAPAPPAAPVPVPLPLPPAPAAPAPPPLPAPPPAPAPPPGTPPPPISTGGAPPGALAVAGLSFPVADSARAGTLTLRIGGLKPLVVNVIACPTTKTFKPVENGPLGDVPPYDCTTHDVAALTADGTAIHFDHLDPMVYGGTLSFVLLPGAADRLVLTRPGAGALVVVPGTQPPLDLAPLAPVPAPATPAPAPVAAPAPVIAPVTVAPPVHPRRHHRAAVLPSTVAAPSLPPGPRAVLIATLALVAAGALVLGRPTAPRATGGLHRFARARTGPAPRV
ncbi:MAG TPA: hypothetical protein VH134_01640 [Candidatus Dormibacteraeota bacterium]|nr:hypothetical protein [Candidatus Dormibacteraeota bacterium]